jgi:hypothetical protein
MGMVTDPTAPSAASKTITRTLRMACATGIASRSRISPCAAAANCSGVRLTRTEAPKLFHSFVVGHERDGDFPGIGIARGARQQVRRVDVDSKRLVDGGSGETLARSPISVASNGLWAAASTSIGNSREPKCAGNEIGLRRPAAPTHRTHVPFVSALPCARKLPEFCDVSHRNLATPSNRRSRNSRGNPSAPAGWLRRRGRSSNSRPPVMPVYSSRLSTL